ncbi:hypothetical protein P9112_007367 [Eukaryota sp. TZLM1-RC]
MQFCTLPTKYGLQILDELENGLSHYLAARGLSSVEELIGCLLPTPEKKIKKKKGSKNLKHHRPTRGIAWIQFLKRNGFEVLMINEVFTSAKCPVCFEKVATFLRVTNPRFYRREKTPVTTCHGLLACSSESCKLSNKGSTKLFNRNKLACLNMLAIAEARMSGDERPQYLCDSDCNYYGNFPQKNLVLLCNNSYLFVDSYSMRHSRRHGLQRPFDVVQIIAISIFGFFASGFFLVLLPFIPPFAFVYVAYPWIFLLSLGVFLKLWCSFIDPADPSVDYTRITRSSKTLPPGFRVVDEQNYCCICKTHVLPNSKHCKLCNKCVSNFDHHCRYLNTCVSKAHNYVQFFVLLIIMTFLAVSLCITTFLVFLFIIFGPLRSHFRSISFKWVKLAFLSLIGLVSLPTSYLLLQLLIFHVGLLRSGLTTYDFIVRSRKRKSSTSAPPPLPSDEVVTQTVIQKVDPKRHEELKKKQPSVVSCVTICTPSCISNQKRLRSPLCNYSKKED